MTAKPSICTLPSLTRRRRIENNAQKTISSIDLGNITGTMKYGELLKNTEVRAFYYYYNDHRNIPGVLGRAA